MPLQTFTPSTCPFFVSFWSAVLGSSFCIIIDFLMSQSLLFNYDINKLSMMQKLEPNFLKPTKVGHVNRVIEPINLMTLFWLYGIRKVLFLVTNIPTNLVVAKMMYSIKI